MASSVQKLAAASESTGLSFDRSRNILYGNFNGYSFAVTLNASNARYCSIYSYVTKDGNPFTSIEGKQIAKDSNKLVEFLKPGGSAPCSFLIKLEKDELGTAEKICEALTYLSESFLNWGFVNTCEQCRQPVTTAPCAVGNGIRFVCDDCFESISAHMNDKAHVEAETPENVAAGIVGALGGALLGAIVVVIFGQLGYVTALSGLIAAVCSLKGYELLAKKMSIKGAIISCVAMLAMIYVGVRANWAIEIAKAFDVDFFRSFRSVPEIIREGEIYGEYIKNLLMVLLFALLGAVPTVIRSIKGQNTKFTVQKLN